MPDKLTADTITDEQLRNMRKVRAWSGDHKTASLAERAIAGSRDARARCADIINAGSPMPPAGADYRAHIERTRG